jgi:hypothetical protein
MSLNNLEEFRKAKYYNYNNTEYDFVGIIKEILDIDVDKLDNLHKILEKENNRNDNTIKFEEDQTTELHKKYYNSSSYYKMVELYDKFVKEVVIPLFPENETKFAVQVEPNIRFSLPNSSALGKRDDDPKEMIGYHTDGMYGHPEGEINFVIACSRIKDTNGFYFETEPNNKIYEHLDMDVGQYFNFYGNKCNHFNRRNIEDITRVSLDFRIIPESLYYTMSDKKSAKSSRSFNIGGYFKEILRY